MIKQTMQLSTPSDKEVQWMREFDAPREKVFEALVNPDLLRRWLLGPDGWSMPTCEVDLRVGGKYRYIWRHPEKGDMGISGVYKEIKRPEKIVHTEAFDDPWYSGEAVVTTTLTDRGGRTLMTTTMLLASKEARDGVLKSGMEHGLEPSYARMDAVLAEM